MPPREPVKIFARWDTANVIYIEDANGHIWSQRANSKPVRIRGNRAEVEALISSGQLRGTLIAKNPRRRSKRAIRPPKSDRVTRPSKITKKTPTKRLRKLRTKNVRVPAKFVIVARKSASAPRMHFDGKNFSQRKTVKKFGTATEAASRARQLIAAHPILRKYRVTVEGPPRPQ